MPDASVRPEYAVLLMAHGTPESLDQLPDFLRRVRDGREPSADLITEIRHHYEAIGGRSPATAMTLAQAGALQAVLDERGVRALVVVGMRNWRPSMAEAMARIREAGIRRVIGVPLAPQYSTVSVQRYVDAAQAALPEGVTFEWVRSLHDHPLLVEAFAERLRAAAPGPDEDVVFTAHSVPERVGRSDDPYPAEVAATAAAVAARCGLSAYVRAYQSAGRTPEPWMGPDLSDRIRERAAAGVRRILVVPIGFVCDHTEVLFDIDIQAARTARECGVTLRRTESLNASPTFIRALAAVVVHAASGDAQPVRAPSGAVASPASDTVDVAIVGAGISGLAAAYELHQRGFSLRVLERGPRPGGVIVTERIDGFTLDAGPDSVLAMKPAAIELCRQLGLGDQLMPMKPPRTSFILRNRRLHQFPEASYLGFPTRILPLATSRLFTWGGKVRMASEVLVPRRVNADADESIASFVRRRFGDEAVEFIAEPLLGGIHAGDIDRLSMCALFPRLLKAEKETGSVILAFRSLHGSRSGEGPFRTLRGGMSDMVEAIVRLLPGEALQCDGAVRRIDHGDLFEIDQEGRRPLKARALILASPPHVVAHLLAPLDADLAGLCRRIPCLSTATVLLAYPRGAVGHPLNGSGFVVPKTEGLAITAVGWVSSKWADRAPEGHVLLRAFFGGARDPDVLSHSDDELADTTHAELSGILGIHEEPQFARVYRWDRSNPQQEIGHLDLMGEIDRRLARWPGLHISSAGFRGIGVSDCVADARSVAAVAAERLKDR
jgi:protoporphyrinogen/coproporphyrinogen III oxidase